MNTSGVVDDPVGAVVAAVGLVDSSLDAPTVNLVVEQVSGGRAKSRRLAAAISQDPSVLTTGRSPAPRVVGDLLLALRAAGASRIAAPCCATCGREVSSMLRRGVDWYCALCVVRRQICSACGQQRHVSSRDRHGNPRCSQCADLDDDPLTELIELVTALDPSVGVTGATSAIVTTATRTADIQKLVWALQAAPELLTGDGAHAPFPMILRLIDNLCAVGATVICRPACARCGRVVTLSKQADGLRICRNCKARSSAVACSRCGDVREPASRRHQGRTVVLDVSV